MSRNLNLGLSKRKLKPGARAAPPLCSCVDIQPMALAAARLLAAEGELERVEAELQAVSKENAKLRAENLELKRVKRQLEKLVSSTLAAARAAAQAAEDAQRIIVERGNECREEEVVREQPAWFIPARKPG